MVYRTTVITLLVLILIGVTYIIIDNELEEITFQSKINTLTENDSVATEAKYGIEAIMDAYNGYLQQHGTLSNYTVEQAIQDIDLDETIIQNWTFKVVGNPPQRFVATSTGGAGEIVWYDVMTVRYHGFGIDY